MKFITSILILVLFSGCFNQSNKKDLCVQNEISTRKDLFNDIEFQFHSDTLYYKNEKYSGYIYSFFPNSVDTSFASTYFKGLQNGLAKKWYPNKQIMEARFFCSGKKHGKQVSFWENGNKRFEFNANQDAYEGKMEEWNKEGKLYHLGNYVHGQEEGEQKLWYDDGKIRANYVIKNGKRYGLLGTKNCTNVSDSIFTRSQ